jgi:hypothetical protein
VPDSFTDLAGLDVSAEDFLSAVLAAAGQPIWVVDWDDVIRFANPAAHDGGAPLAADAAPQIGTPDRLIAPAL